MGRIKLLALAAIAAFAMALGAPKAAAQINFYIGVAPACPYGYYDYAPHNCAPDGYFGPEWFNGGVFIGTGPWFHGSNDFHGKVDNSFDPQRGYSGPLPKVGEKPAAQRRGAGQFKGNEVRDGRGNISGEGRRQSVTLPPRPALAVWIFYLRSSCLRAL
ncbi:MAG: hypothetical protein ABSF23_10205 [Terracidiphilus sp.]|jgi:hypothetical protein